MIEAITSAAFGITPEDFCSILIDCDHPTQMINNRTFARHLNQKGFWRIEKQNHPEHRLTILSLVALKDLQDKIAECGGDLQQGIEAFCSQNDGDGWMLPETLRLADYGLGQDERALEPQPVRACFGPRFFDWQLAQSFEESWRECRLHARNQLGEAGYQSLLDELAGYTPQLSRVNEPVSSHSSSSRPWQGELFPKE
jgi:hypothetical protein